ncbi:hypothetical protein AGLY_014115 [Aphis glycines]|uniref:Uncharacterized protein n=1 Tax=Aphis glycines TaxID=307491 RepID=A0A6G0T6B0_APHGL|nr:hypothetical protein AGLY_014115 [Aphis glycines]
MIPMSVMRDTLGLFWDDRSYRKTAYRLSVMGQMKVYGGSWNLPGVKDFGDPFALYVVQDEDAYAASTSAAPPTTLTTPEKPTASTSASPVNVRKALQSMSLNSQLPLNHPLVTMLKNTLKISHGESSNACDNYIANVSLVLYHVHDHLVKSGTPPMHWADLVRKSLGQTKATTISYLKNLRLLIGNIIKCYVNEEGSFPKGFDLFPCQETIIRIKVLDHKLDLLYKRTTKQQPAELIQRKTNEAQNIPDYSDVVASLAKIYSTIDDNLKDLESAFEAKTGTLVVRSEKTSSYSERMSTVGLAIHLLWASKQRSGVAVNMTLREWEARQEHAGNVVVIVSDHKTGDKEPASLVIDDEMASLMDRYYQLRSRTGFERQNFFLTNRGEKIVKIYDNINKIYGARLSANVLRRMVETSSRDHGTATSAGIAKALQHSDDTVVCFEDIFDPMPYKKFVNSEWIERLKDEEIYREYPLFLFLKHGTPYITPVQKIMDRSDGAQTVFFLIFLSIQYTCMHKINWHICMTHNVMGQLD